MIKTWGQTPKQLFSAKHAGIIRPVHNFEENRWYKLDSNSIHNQVINVKWGSYVGSLEQQGAPVCVWKENCKKNIVQLISLANGEVIGLAQHRCLIIDRVKDTNLKSPENLPSIIEWASFDDVIKVFRSDNEKSINNLIYIRGNEQVLKKIKFYKKNFFNILIYSDSSVL